MLKMIIDLASYLGNYLDRDTLISDNIRVVEYGRRRGYKDILDIDFNFTQNVTESISGGYAITVNRKKHDISILYCTGTIWLKITEDEIPIAQLQRLYNELLLYI